MKRVAYAALAVALATASFRFVNEARPDVTPSASLVQLSPAASPSSGMTWSGMNSRVSGPEYLPSGTYSYTWRAIGTGTFVIYTDGQVKNQQLVNTVLPDYRTIGLAPTYPTAGDGLLSSPGAWLRVHVEASSVRWQFHLDWLTR